MRLKVQIIPLIVSKSPLLQLFRNFEGGFGDPYRGNLFFFEMDFSKSDFEGGDLERIQGMYKKEEYYIQTRQIEMKNLRIDF